MLGTLPKSLEINGVDYAINTDFRNILPIFAAFADNDLTDKEKLYVCMERLFVDLGSLPAEDYTAAYEAAVLFLEGGSHDSKPGPRVVDWERDERLIFPAVNTVAGVPEVRDLEYMHWWTFLGHFMSIDPESLYGTVLRIRQKRAKGKKLEKYEQEFERANRELCQLRFTGPKERPEDSAKSLFDELLKEGGGG